MPVHGKAGNGASKTCMAEDQCIDKHCGKGYDHTSSKFPYSINYTKWAWPGEDVFDFRVRPPLAHAGLTYLMGDWP